MPGKSPSSCICTAFWGSFPGTGPICIPIQPSLTNTLPGPPGQITGSRKQSAAQFPLRLSGSCIRFFQKHGFSTSLHLCRRHLSAGRMQKSGVAYHNFSLRISLFVTSILSPPYSPSILPSSLPCPGSVPGVLHHNLPPPGKLHPASFCAGFVIDLRA